MLNSSHAQTQASSSGWWFVWQKCPFCLCVSSHLNVIGLFVHERPLFSFMTSVHLHAPNTGLLWCLNVWLNGSQMSPKVLLILKGLLPSIRNWSSGSIWRKKLRCCSSGVGYRQGVRFLNAYFESLIKSHMCWTVAATTSLCSNVCGIRPWRAALNSCSVPSSPLQVCNVQGRPTLSVLGA